MMDGALFLGIATLVCIGVALNGFRFARMTRNPWVGKTLLGTHIEGADLPIEKVRHIGLLQLVAAPLFWLFAAALCFGLLGPVDNIQTIKFN